MWSLAVPSTVSLAIACIYLGCIAFLYRNAIKARQDLEASLLGKVSSSGQQANQGLFLWKFKNKQNTHLVNPANTPAIDDIKVKDPATSKGDIFNSTSLAEIKLERLEGWQSTFPEDLDMYRQGVLDDTTWSSDLEKHTAEIAPWVWHHRGRADILYEQILSEDPKTRKDALMEMAQLGIPLNFESRASASFVVLIRNKELKSFLPTLRKLEQRFNNRFHYPYLFLNDKPFSKEFMQKVAASTTSNVTFARIPSDHWSMPDFIDPDEALRARNKMKAAHVIYGGSLSYRHMCRFNSGFFYKHPLLQNVDWYWRVEPGVDFYCDIDYDPFHFMERNNKLYSFVVSLKEIEKTIPSLWEHTLEYMLENNITSDWMSYFATKDGDYNLCHFWSNFEIASLRWLRSDAYDSYFKYLDEAKGFFMERWGDAPVHSLAAGMLLERKQIHFFDDIGYRHEKFGRCPEITNADLERKCQCPKDLVNFDNFDYHKDSCLPQWKSLTSQEWSNRDSEEALRLVRKRRRFTDGLEPLEATERRKWYNLFGIL
ncbi:hypothetical protein H4R20_000833 [Coemansia guatemalensis]|uniref:Uncharacterized protein n=1 Tax=Coemansia guatemalensis TaxID=2761395 RepID=A0A9W8HY65_9FUNG|nr:hypothetical protein H4R20_000833 [Coemansia guatemalensis]